MKTKLFIMVLILFIPLSIIAQDKKRDRKFEKLEELERKKITEIIGLDENSAKQFFNKREEHKTKMRELNKKLDDNYDALEKFSENKNPASAKELINNHLLLTEEISKERRNYSLFLRETLEDEKFIKLIVFEKKFRDEVRNALFKSRTKKNRSK